MLNRAEHECKTQQNDYDTNKDVYVIT